MCLSCLHNQHKNKKLLIQARGALIGRDWLLTLALLRGYSLGCDGNIMLLRALLLLHRKLLLCSFSAPVASLGTPRACSLNERQCCCLQPKIGGCHSPDVSSFSNCSNSPKLPSSPTAPTSFNWPVKTARPATQTSLVSMSSMQRFNCIPKGAVALRD